MTKAGGIPAHPIGQPETSGLRALGKGGSARDGVETGFGFPEHLTSLQSDQDEPDAQVPAGARGRQGLSLVRSVLAVDRGSGRDTEIAPKLQQDSIDDFVADLKRMLAGELATPPVSGEADGTAVGDPARLEENLLDTLQNVVALIPHGAARTIASVARHDAARADGAEAKVLPLPLGSRHAATPGDASPRARPVGHDVAVPMPGAALSDDVAEFPSNELRPMGRSVARNAEGDTPHGLEREIVKSEVKVSVVRQETHFAPMMRSSPAVQIADALANGFTDLEAQSATRPAVDPAAPKPSSTAPLRVLQVQLQPVELGTVTVSLSLKADVLELHLEAMRADTADMLRRDREVLSDLLRQAGYDIDAVSVRIADADAGPLSGGQTASPTTGQPQPVSASGQAQGGWSMPEDRSRGARQQSGHDHPQGQAHGDPARTDGADADSRGLYI